MSGNRKGNGNRQRNVSMTSNTSASSFKDNSTLNQQRISQQQSISQLDLGVAQLSNVSDRRQRSAGSNNATSSAREELRNQPNRAGQWTNSSPRPSSLFDSINFDFSEDRSEPPVNVIRAEMANDTTLYTPIDNRSRKLQEAQQRLLQLQELMQNVSLDLDCNPFAQQQQQEEHKNNKPRRDVRDLSLDFLRNVPSTSSGYTRTTTSIPRVNPNVSRLSNQHYAGAQQNNLSHDSLSSPKRYPSQSQVNGSHHLTMLDVFHPRSEPSFDDSSDDDVNEDDDPIDADDDEEDNIPHALPNQLVNGGEANSSTPRNTIRIPIEHLERIENQIDRTNSLCELLVVEQRRLAMVTESLLSAVTTLQTNAHQTPPTRAAYRGHPTNFSMSGLPMNSSWNGDGGGDYNVLAGAVGQCCLMLTQLQRELASAMDQTPPHVNRATPSNENSTKTRSSASCSYEMDRFDAARQAVTLNNRVPPGTRTNNYWDNFRSYSRQNLLSTAGPTNNTAADLPFHAQTPGGGSSGSEQQQQQQQSSSIGAHRVAMAALSLPIDETRLLHQQQQQQHQQQLTQPVRRTKRKVNKGQTTAHADNRQLAYGLLGVRNVNSDGAVFGSVATDGAMGGAMGIVSSSDNNKVAKDTSTLKYSGARPKERRATPEQTQPQQQQSSFPLPPPNVNLMAERKQSEDKTSLEAVVRGALSEVHSGRPQFVSQLLDLLHKLDSEPLRQNALQALQDCVRDDRQQPPPPSTLASLSPSELFSRMATNHRELTPNLLDSFLSAIQLPTSAGTGDELDQDIEEMEGATGASLIHHHQSVYLVRNALTPFLFRRLSDVHDVIVDTLAKLESSNTSSANRTADQSTASASGREDELAEADQSCDQSCDGTTTEAMEMWNDNSNRIGSAVGLDEVPTRLMSILQPPVWTSSPGRPATAGPSVSANVAMDETANPRNDWLPPTSDGGV